MDVDVAVLGGGPGGYSASIRAAQLGAKVACIEMEPELGGTCLRVGCIPTKAWVQTAFALKEAEESFAKFGVNVGHAELDFAASNAWKAGVVKQMTSGVAHVEVDDLKTEAERLREAGVEVGIVVELGGEMRLLDVFDPDGNRLQFAQELRA